MKIPGIDSVTIEPYIHKDFHQNIAEAVLHFEGDIRDLESAIGAYYLAHIIGLKPLYVIHSKKTVKKYINLISDFGNIGDETDMSEHIPRYVEARSKSNFWKAVSGDTKLTRSRYVDFYNSLFEEMNRG